VDHKGKEEKTKLNHTRPDGALSPLTTVQYLSLDYARESAAFRHRPASKDWRQPGKRVNTGAVASFQWRVASLKSHADKNAATEGRRERGRGPQCDSPVVQVMRFAGRVAV
jgi:hypothetical protein